MLGIFTFIKKYYPFLFFIVIIILTVLLFQTLSTLRKERKDREYQEQQDAQNNKALLDSITVVFNKKLKAWEYSKDNYVVQKLSDLEKYDKEFADELKKVKGDVIAAIKSEVQGDLGGIEATTKLKVLDASTNYYGLNFSSHYKDAGFEQKITGMSKFHVIPDELTKKWSIVPDPTTVLDTNFVSLNMTYGFKEYNDRYQVFVNTQSDKIKVTGLEGGYFINKQPLPPTLSPKKWGIGPYVGYGLNTGPGLSDPRFGFNIGLALHYDIIQFRLGKK